MSEIDRLPQNINYLTRKEEVLKWNTETSETAFVIIDDDKSLNDLPADIKEKLLLTYFLIGLDKSRALMAIEMLKTHTKRY